MGLLFVPRFVHLTLGRIKKDAVFGHFSGMMWFSYCGERPQRLGDGKGERWEADLNSRRKSLKLSQSATRKL
jgi:hypothetical protein